MVCARFKSPHRGLPARRHELEKSTIARGRNRALRSKIEKVEAHQAGEGQPDAERRDVAMVVAQPRNGSHPRRHLVKYRHGRIHSTRRRRPRIRSVFLPTIAARSDVQINLTTGGAPNMLVDERLQPGGPGIQAGSGLAEHGLDELRPVSDARSPQGIQARVGAPIPGGPADRGVPQHVQGDLATSWNPAPATAPASKSSATTPAISTRRRDRPSLHRCTCP